MNNVKLSAVFLALCMFYLSTLRTDGASVPEAAGRAKRPSWLHGRRDIDSELVLSKRPSWLHGRSLEEVPSAIGEMEGGVYLNEKRPSWLHGKREMGGEEKQFMVRKRPSWLIGRSFKQPSRAKKPSTRWHGRRDLGAQESTEEMSDQDMLDFYDFLKIKQNYNQ